MESHTLIKILIRSYTSNDINIVLKCLYQLQPDKLSIEELAHLVRHVESVCSTDRFAYEHYNSIRTGGDKLKTINITSIAAILASRYLDIIKLGARGITSKWGSRDFNSILIEQQNN